MENTLLYLLCSALIIILGLEMSREGNVRGGYTQRTTRICGAEIRPPRNPEAMNFTILYSTVGQREMQPNGADIHQ